MKIVIISRIIYPLLSPRAFRATELAKEFARLGYDVTLYGVLGKYDYKTFSEATGVKVKHIKMHLGTADSDGKVRYTIFDKLAYHAFGRLLEYPDIEFCWKVPALLKKERNINLLITIAHPHPIHWGAALAKKLLKDKFPKFWISDCGDPYMGNTVHKKHPVYFHIIEDFWGRQTDKVTIPVEGAKSGYSSKIQHKIEVIPQGFDFENIKLADYSPNNVPHFAYAGTVYPGYRDPSTFLDYLISLNLDFVFTVYTKSSEFYKKYKDILGNKLVLKGYIPREQLLYELSKQDFLINFTNPSAIQTPSKLIDYYLSARPIINISTPFNENKTFHAFLKGDYTESQINPDISCYDIKNVAKKFLDLYYSR